ncbi:MAG: hypothetical protein R6W66_04620 [Pelovirga sp.]
MMLNGKERQEQKKKERARRRFFAMLIDRVIEKTVQSYRLEKATSSFLIRDFKGYCSNPQGAVDAGR